VYLENCSAQNFSNGFHITNTTNITLKQCVAQGFSGGAGFRLAAGTSKGIIIDSCIADSENATGDAWGFLIEMTDTTDNTGIIKNCIARVKSSGAATGFYMVNSGVPIKFRSNFSYAADPYFQVPAEFDTSGGTPTNLPYYWANGF
jgi:hypothetical protein